MGVSSIANKKHNIRNIKWNTQGWKTGIFVGIEETNSPDWSWMVATKVTGTPFVFILSGKVKNRKYKASYCRHGNNSLPEQINKTLNAAAIQLSNISCGGNHQS